MLDVLLPSAYFCDLVFTGLSDIPKLGDEVFSQGFKIIPGAGFIPAVALTRLGLQIGWSCDFGNDFFSRFVLEEARRQNLRSDLFRVHDHPLQAVSVAYSFAGDRAFLSYIDPLPPIDLVDLLNQNPARCLMLMSLQKGSEFLEAAQAAHARETLLFMDGQVMGHDTLANPAVVAAIKAVDFFSLNQKEALKLTGEKSTESALDRLADLTPTVVIKMGADGAIGQSRDQRVHMPGIPSDVVDTTGAGDNFDCGFVYGILQSYSLADCLRCGNFCGSRSTASYGGWSTSPKKDELEAHLQIES